MNKRITYHFVFLAVILGGCNSSSMESTEPKPQVEKMTDYSREEMTLPEYKQWHDEEATHLVKSQENDPLKMELAYFAPEFWALLELQGEKPTPENWDTLVKNHQTFSQFRLRISALGSQEEFIKIGKPDPTAYEERVKYFAFGMQQDIVGVVNQKDTIPCSMYHFERVYGVSPESTFLIAFENVASMKELQIIIKEKVFSEEEWKFDFTKEELINVPQLKLF